MAEINRMSEDYRAGYTKGYSDKKAYVNKVKKELEERHCKEIANLHCSMVWPMNLIQLIFEDVQEDSTWIFAPEFVLEVINGTLTERESDVLVCLYRDKMTLEDVGKKYHVTRERIRQIEAKAVRKLRHPTRSKAMRAVKYSDFMDLQNKYNILEEEYRYFVENGCTVEEAEEIKDIRDKSIDELDLSVRSYNCLKRAGIETIGQLISKSFEEIARIRNLGKRSTSEIKDKLMQYGLGFTEEV